MIEMWFSCVFSKKNLMNKKENRPLYTHMETHRDKLM